MTIMCHSVVSFRFSSRLISRIASSAVLLATSALALSAQATTGPVIMSGGAVFDVPDPTFVTPMNADFKVVFEIVRGVTDATSPAGANAPAALVPPNEQLGTVARFLNMHARAGVPRERVMLAAVVHGTAGKDLLDDETYRARYGTANPSAPLIKELLAAGVRIVLCGQTAAGRNVPRDRLIPGVQVALSAMTAMSVLQSDGYRLNPW